MGKTTTHRYKIIKVTRKYLDSDNKTIHEQVHYRVYEYAGFLLGGWRPWRDLIHDRKMWCTLEDATEALINSMNKWIEQYRADCIRSKAQKRLQKQLKETRVQVGLCTWVVDEETQTFVKREISTQ